MTPFRRILYALIISFEIHVLVLISASGQLGSRAGPRSMSGFELVEVVRLGSEGIDARVTENKTMFDKATPRLKPVKSPSPPPAMKKQEHESERPADDRKRKEDKNRRTSEKQRLGPAAPEGPEPAAPEVGPEAEDEGNDKDENTGDEVRENENTGPELSSPICASCPPPQYPSLAERRGLEGKVVLKLQVLPDGSVGDIFVDSSSGYSSLDEAAMAGVKDWVFYPATRGDQPVTVTMEKTVVFQMEGR